jgi:hypothetical protein
LNTFPLSTWNAAEAFRLAIVSTLLKFNSIILRFCFRKIMESIPKSKRQILICKLQTKFKTPLLLHVGKDLLHESST